MTVARLINKSNHAYLPTAWWAEEIKREFDFLFPNQQPWAHGIEPNRKSIESFLTYCHEQGLTDRILRAEELFAKELNLQVRI